MDTYEYLDFLGMSLLTDLVKEAIQNRRGTPNLPFRIAFSKHYHGQPNAIPVEVITIETLTDEVMRRANYQSGVAALLGATPFEHPWTLNQRRAMVKWQTLWNEAPSYSHRRSAEKLIETLQKKGIKAESVHEGLFVRVDG